MLKIIQIKSFVAQEVANPLKQVGIGSKNRPNKRSWTMENDTLFLLMLRKNNMSFGLAKECSQVKTTYRFSLGKKKIILDSQKFK